MRSLLLINPPDQNGLKKAARTPDGQDVVIRIICVGDQGKEHLDILRQISQGELALLSSNHALPMFRELTIDDMIFGVFPRVGERMGDCYEGWPKNSIGDILDMILQALEVSEYSSIL